MQLELARAAKQAKVTETEPTLPEASSSVQADSPQPSTSGASFSEPTDPEIHTEDEIQRMKKCMMDTMPWQIMH